MRVARDKEEIIAIKPEGKGREGPLLFSLSPNIFWLDAHRSDYCRK